MILPNLVTLMNTQPRYICTSSLHYGIIPACLPACKQASNIRLSSCCYVQTPRTIAMFCRLPRRSFAWGDTCHLCTHARTHLVAVYGITPSEGNYDWSSDFWGNDKSGCMIRSSSLRSESFLRSSKGFETSTQGGANVWRDTQVS